MSFTHLHLHTEFSLLDGLNKINNLAKRLKELGMDSVAITDHGSMYGAIDFYTTMLRDGIKPIIGIEAYIHNGEELNDKSVETRFHLCLFAKDYEGYKNLMYLSSQAYINGFYYKPRINKRLLKEYKNGLVCSTACLQGEINWHLNTQNERNVRNGAKGYERAKEIAQEYKDLFGDDFYLEIMRHGIRDQLFIDNQILRIAKELDIKVVATNDTHYTNKDDAETQNTAFLILMGGKNKLKHIVSEFYIKSPQEMERLFLDIPEAITNTKEIVQKCNLTLPLKNTTIINKETGEHILEHSQATPPSFRNTKLYAKNEALDKIKNIEEIDDAWYFEYKCHEGLRERLKKIPEEKHEVYKKRLQHEIDMISKMNFQGYMLIVWDFINFAKQNNIPIGPGRGSAAGSLVTYSLKITNVDPIKYDLLFERFLNPERISMPDIDTDICQRRRGEVIDYMVETYGRYNVAQVITYNSLKAKGVIRDVARVLGFPLQDADILAKLIPDRIKDEDGQDVKANLENSLKYVPEIKTFLKEKGMQDVWDKALALEHLKRNEGVHAAAIVLDSEQELWHKSPLFTSEKTGGITTQYSMDWLEAVDLIKFDFLGLKTLTVIDDALHMIEQRYGTKIDFENMEMDDPKVFEMLKRGDTAALFQLESAGMQAACRKVLPSSFEDIASLIALYRPGPMDNINDFAARKDGSQKINYIFDTLKPVLSSTYGIIVYQEQIMQIVQIIAGFSLAKADIVRRAMGKKKREEMIRMNKEFVEGAKKNGFDEKKSQELWDFILKFANYGFNRSHAVAYAFVAYQTAYLKAHYQHEFMAAMLSSEYKVETIAHYVQEVRQLGIDVRPPHVNYSLKDFSVIDEENGKKSIVFGLNAIKGLGEAPVEDIIANRQNAPYKDLNDFISRVDFSKLNKRAIEPLIKSGCLDGMGYSRESMLKNVDSICESGRSKDEIKKMLVNSLFSSEDISKDVALDFENLPEMDKSQLLAYEFETMGIYVSGHPLDKHKDKIEKLASKININKISEIEKLRDGDTCFIACVVHEIKRKSSKNGHIYGRVSIGDYSGTYELTLFEKQLKELEELEDEIKNEEPIVFKSKIQVSFRDEKNEFRPIGIYSISSAYKKIKTSKFNEDVKEGQEAQDEVAKIQEIEYEKPSGVDSKIEEMVLDSCLPITLFIDASEEVNIFNKIKELDCKGERELRVVIEDGNERYTFVTALKVSSKIKEHFPNKKWSV